jgi:hypothetical protein
MSLTKAQVLLKIIQYFRFNEDIVVSSDPFVTNYIENSKSGFIHFYVAEKDDVVLPLALGLALSVDPSKRIIVFQSKDELMRNFDGMLSVRNEAPPNLAHIVFNENRDLNLKKAALSFGYNYSFLINAVSSIDAVMGWVNDKEKEGSKFIEISIEVSEEDVSISNINPKAAIEKFEKRMLEDE